MRPGARFGALGSRADETRLGTLVYAPGHPSQGKEPFVTDSAPATVAQDIDSLAI